MKNNTVIRSLTKLYKLIDGSPYAKVPAGSYGRVIDRDTYILWQDDWGRGKATCARVKIRFYFTAEGYYEDLWTAESAVEVVHGALQQ